MPPKVPDVNVPAPSAAAASPPATAAAPGEARFVATGKALAEAVRVVAQLRAPGGCPWDAEQTLQSLVPYMLEEAAEAAAAARAGDVANLRDELGDVLLQVLLQSEIAQEAGHFDLAAVAGGLTAKLIRRHPHVFAAGSQQEQISGLAQDDARPTATDGRAAAAVWEAAKATEQAGAAASSPSRIDQVPTALPALQRCQKIAHRVAKVGFDWPDVAGPLAKLDEEIGEVKEALAELTATRATGTAQAQAAAHQALADEIGDALFSLVNVARHLDVAAEETLHRTIERFCRRFRRVEAGLAARGLTPGPTQLDLMNELWQQAKQNHASR